jgi:hypothetical protein
VQQTVQTSVSLLARLWAQRLVTWLAQQLVSRSVLLLARLLVLL